jgi:hypothetical protein
MQVMTGTSNAQQEFHTVKRKKFDLNRSLLSSLLSSHHALNMQNDGGETMEAASSAGFLSSRVTIGVGGSRGCHDLFVSRRCQQVLIIFSHDSDSRQYKRFMMLRFLFQRDSSQKYEK